jgi:prepilin-type N-terminal cleavage/methylation domain-containing protein
MIMRKNGYSMIELMVVVTLVAILGTTMVGLFMTTLRSGGKATSIARIKEEGDYAMSTLERLIRVGTNACDGLPITNATSLTVDELSDADAAPRSIYRRSVDETAIEIETKVGPPNGDEVTRSLTSNNVVVSELFFDCTPGTGFNQGDTVTIRFTMMADGDEVTTETFDARVVLRNTSS